MHVSELWIYPIKSCRGVRVATLELGDRGPLNDRRFMLVDRSNRFITQREQPRLTLVSVAVTETGNVTVAADGYSKLEIKPPAAANGQPCSIFEDTVDLTSASLEANQWFSDYLGIHCTLMYMPDASERVVNRDYSPERRLVSLADGFPLLLIGMGSLDLLNSKLTTPVTMQRFRPNVVVTGSAPHAEDSWREISIGEVTCSVVKPCARCVIPTVDLATGVKGKEPSRTLASYRKQGSKVLFGQNLIHQAPGCIHEGAAISVIR